MRKMATLLLIALAAHAARAEETAPPAPQSAPAPQSGTATTKEPFYLITDYLPQAIYDADSVTGCFRVENTTGKEDSLDLAIKVTDDAGGTVEDVTKAVLAPISGFGQCQHTQDIRKA